MRKVAGEDPRDFLLYQLSAGNTVEIWDIKVLSQRRAGVGRKLVETMIREISGLPRPLLVFAITRVSDRIAQCFYEGLGFRRMAVISRFYPLENEDAVMYGLDL